MASTYSAANAVAVRHPRDDQKTEICYLNQPSLSAFLYFNMTDVTLRGKLFPLLLLQLISADNIQRTTRTITWIARPLHLLLNFNILSNIKRPLPTAVTVLIKDLTNKLLNPFFVFCRHFFFVYFSFLWKEKRNVPSLELEQCLSNCESFFNHLTYICCNMWCTSKQSAVKFLIFIYNKLIHLVSLKVKLEVSSNWFRNVTLDMVNERT